MQKPNLGLRNSYLILILLATLITPLFAGPYIKIEIKSFFYALSLSMRAILLTLTPFIIFSFLFFSLINLRSSAFKFVVLLLLLVFASNFLAIGTSFIVGYKTLTHLHLPALELVNNTTPLTPLWKLKLPKIISNELALILGFSLGIIFSFKNNQIAEKVAFRLHQGANFFLRRLFTPLLPIFILGFIFKLEHDQLLSHSFKFYGSVFIIIILTQVSYMLIVYLLLAKFSPKTFLKYIGNILPATLTGFGTLSSIATMPVLINATARNTNDEEMAKTIIPATINIHTIGSIIGLIILSLAAYLTFTSSLPPISEVFKFTLYYALAKFAVVAVPGGVVIVICPLLETLLGFTPEMSGIIIATYMLIDPFCTATNVTGNGAFAILLHRLHAPKPLN